MVKFINKLTGNAMYVADDRKNEYLSAGHRLALGVSPESAAPSVAVRQLPQRGSPKKDTAKKTTKSKR